MIALPVRRESAPLATRPVSSRAAAPARPEASSDLDEALAKVKTPADDEIAKQQQAFDRLMMLRTENEREIDAIRAFGLAQAKKEDEFLQAFIRMI
jgi:hypothetical protein